MKKLILFSLFFIALTLHTTIHKVGVNQTYSTIQNAINISGAMDTILVYPGTYTERLRLNQKSLTIGSLYLLTGDSLYASQTIIDGNFAGSVLKAEYCPYLKIAGFTFQHGTGTFDPESFLYDGSSLLIYFCDEFILDNNIIQYNVNSNGGALGIVQSPSLLSANVIRFNSTNERGYAGGINIIHYFESPEFTVIFDPFRRNDVYFNTGPIATDIAFYHFNSAHVILNKFTVLNPDDYYIRLCVLGAHPFLDYQSLNLTTDIREGMVSPVNADLYVNTEGDDNNSGLSSDNALKTIFKALLKIKADSLNHRTIYIAPGVYAYEKSTSLFPLKLKSYVGLKGLNGFFTLQSDDLAVIRALACTDAKIENLKIENSPGKYGLTKILVRSDNFVANNIDIVGSNDNISRQSFETQFCKNIKINNVHLIGRGYTSGMGINSSFNPVYVSNVEIENFVSGFTVDTQSNNAVQSAIPVQVHNILIHNVKNTSISAITGNRLNTLFQVYSFNAGMQKFYLSNISLINNNTDQSVGSMSINGFTDLKMYNSIIYNQYANTIWHTLDYSYDPIQYASYKNCFFPLGEESIELYNSYNGEFLLNMDNIITGDPLLGSWHNLDYIQMPNSPLIDSGTLELPEDLILPEYDLAGNPRISGNSIDIGAYEYQNYMGVQEEIEIIKPAQLHFYPNPLIGQNSNYGSFYIKLNERGNSTLSIYNVKGQKVKTLVHGFREKGESEIYWDGKDDSGKKLPSGVYFYVLKCNDYEVTNKMTIVD